jgi:hypothetical protein
LSVSQSLAGAPLPRARGDWGACWASEVDRLINDIKIPLRLQRQVFLLNLNLGDYGEPECVDFYSIKYHPLFGVPLHPPR